MHLHCPAASDTGIWVSLHQRTANNHSSIHSQLQCVDTLRIRRFQGNMQITAGFSSQLRHAPLSLHSVGQLPVFLPHTMSGDLQEFVHLLSCKHPNSGFFILNKTSLHSAECHINLQFHCKQQKEKTGAFSWIWLLKKNKSGENISTKPFCERWKYKSKATSRSHLSHTLISLHL